MTLDNGDDYYAFLAKKSQVGGAVGFDPLWMPDFLFDFQSVLVEWALKKGRAAIFADCGLGKTPMALVWAENVVRKTNRSVLILAPLAVAQQFVREGEKFGIEVYNARGGKIVKGINVVNYQRMHYFDPDDFVGVCCDESGVLKHFDSKMRVNVTAFLSKIKYRLLGTATPAPNDFMELGTSSEALGEMSRNQMLGMFFSHSGESTHQWKLKGHARKAYWRWMARWARAIRKPSDFGFGDGDFVLPPLAVVEHMLSDEMGGNGRGFFRFANTRSEQLAEKRRTLNQRCEKVAELVPDDRPAVVWCHYNTEADLLERIIPDAVQVAGSHSDELKEERLLAFADGQIRVMVTKPRIAGWGMNWQHCADVFCFPSYSFEEYYQQVRRCWRYGQKNPVVVRLVATEGERRILGSMLRKEKQATQMFEGILREMHEYQVVKPMIRKEGVAMEVPIWL